jgi:DNA helicase-2/ATP-dependent DNA helicase PcrA
MVSGKSDFRVGDRVKHAKLGEGDILDIYPLGEDTCAVISFEKYGQKKIVLQYAKLELVPEQKEEPESEEEEA